MTPASSPDADALVMAGLDAHRAGRITEAAALYTRALVSSPDHADALNLAGAAAFALGKTAEAVRLIGKAIRAKPDHLDAYLNLAEAFEAAGQHRDAIATCSKALAIAPDFAEAHARLALLMASDGDVARALAHARVALALEPELMDAWCAQGIAYGASGRSTDADAAYVRALELAPDNLRALTGRAALLHDTGSFVEAQELYRRAVILRPDDPKLLTSLAALVELQGDPAVALDLFAKASALDPTSCEIRFAYGRCLRDTGAFDAAATAFEQVVQQAPRYAPALLALTRMKRLSDTPDQRKLLARLTMDAGLPVRQRIQAGFAVGEMLDRAEDHDAAFASFVEANALYRQQRANMGEHFDRKQLLDLTALIDRGLARDYATETATWGNPTELPVFVVGLPRSGTTLVEQICASHSQVFGMGESRDVQRTAQAIGSLNTGIDRIGDWDAAHARSQADRLAATYAQVAPGVRRTVDKTPLNLMRLGLINALLPNARVIRCHRDPRDIAVSNHTMFFGHGNNYSTDLADCGFAIRGIDRVGDLWQSELSLNILDVVYEDLVADPEAQVRRIIDFLDLPWEAACLDFHKTDRYVDTPSSWQVRQPLYSTSLGRWRRFEKHLGPLLDELANQRP